MNLNSAYDMITVLGHTAGAKTSLAANIALQTGGEVISADSRQVYRGMTIGTGKDYDDYIINGQKVSSHLLDIVDAGYEFNVYEYQKAFLNIYSELKMREVLPVLCGGSGLYLESILRQYDMLHVPVDNELRASLDGKELPELERILSGFKTLHNRSDIDTRKRAIRAIEIAEYMDKAEEVRTEFPKINSLVIGLRFSRDNRRKRITERLKQRMEEGMIEEVEGLLLQGISHEKLEYYGLEYKYLSKYLKKELSYDEMFAQLNTAIHQFAKRQMTYFRGMEKRGVQIHWLEGEWPLDEKVNKVLRLLSLS